VDQPATSSHQPVTNDKKHTHLFSIFYQKSDIFILILIFSNKKASFIFILKKYFHICSEIESNT